jgi:hypothetical protein
LEDISVRLKTPRQIIGKYQLITIVEIVGLGFFKTVSQSANTKLFFGPRVSYLVYSSDAAGYVKTTETTFSPTLGFEYYLAENFTLGGEAFFNFTKSEGTNSTLIRSKATGSMITIKYFFK